MEIRDKQGLTEREFLAQYQQKDYPRPSYTVDIALFAIMNLGVQYSVSELYSLEKYKISKRTVPKLCILLIKRGGHPFLNCWALPGGFVDSHESAKQAALRELREETGIEQRHLRQVYTFSEPGRDPRAWSVSTAFYMLANDKNLQAVAGDDARDARWFEVAFKCIKNAEEKREDSRVLLRDYELLLRSGEVQLKARIEVKNIITEYLSETKVAIVSNHGLAFDHAKIISYVIYKMRRELLYSGLLFGVLPERFTMRQLQQVYETICDELLIRTEDFMQEVAHFIEKVPPEECVGMDGQRLELFRRKRERSIDW